MDWLWMENDVNYLGLHFPVQFSVWILTFDMYREFNFIWREVAGKYGRSFLYKGCTSIDPSAICSFNASDKLETTVSLYTVLLTCIALLSPWLKVKLSFFSTIESWNEKKKKHRPQVTKIYVQLILVILQCHSPPPFLRWQVFFSVVFFMMTFHKKFAPSANSQNYNLRNSTWTKL